MQRSRTILFGLAVLALASCLADSDSDIAPPDLEGLPESESGAAAGEPDDVIDQGPPADEGAGAPDAGPPPADGGAGVDACPRLRIKTPSSLNVRKATSADAAKLATLFDGEIVDRHANATGQSINGSTTWYQVKLPAVTGYIHSSFAVCTTAPTTGPAGGYYLPFDCNETRRVSQGNNTTFSHKNASRYAFDFSLGVGTPMLAMAPGYGEVRLRPNQARRLLL